LAKWTADVCFRPFARTFRANPGFQLFVSDRVNRVIAEIGFAGQTDNSGRSFGNRKWQEQKMKVLLCPSMRIRGGNPTVWAKELHMIRGRFNTTRITNVDHGSLSI
jgi:hypothetical protein